MSNYQTRCAALAIACYGVVVAHAADSSTSGAAGVLQPVALPSAKRLEPMPLQRSAPAMATVGPGPVTVPLSGAPKASLSGIQTVTSSYGENHEVDISREYPNMIVTPYARPKLVGREGGYQADINNNTILVSSLSEKPVWLSISDRDNPTVAPISLTLKPTSMRSQTIVVQTISTAADAPDLDASRTGYNEALVSVLRDVVRQRVPRGYNVRPLTASLQVEGGFAAQPVERYSGGRGDVYRWRLTNRTNVTQTLSEESFGADPRVLAVTLFPLIALEPGQSTDVLVMTGGDK